MIEPSECRICRAIPDRADREDPDGLPPECEELEALHYNTHRCPLCGTYYDYFYDHDSGGGTSAGGTDELVRRMTAAEAIERIRDVLSDPPFEPKPTLETDLERLIVVHPDPEEPIDVFIQRLDAAVIAKNLMGNRPANLAAWTLGRRKAVEAMPVLVRALASYELRGHAARALGTMGALAAPTLLAQLAAGAVTRTAATYGLGHLARIEPAMAAVIQQALLARVAAIGDSSYGNELVSRELAAVVWAIGMTGYTEAAFAALAGQFGRTYGWERDAAIRAVGRHMGIVTVPALIPLLTASDRYVVEAAILALTELGPAARDAMPALSTCPLAGRFDYLIVRARSAIAARSHAFIVSECRICRTIPEGVHANEHLVGNWRALHRLGLHGLASELCKCPSCGTYYDYQFNEYPGAPEATCDPHTDEILERLTPVRAIERIRDALATLPLEPNETLETDLERLLQGDPQRELLTETAHQRLVSVMAAGDASNHVSAKVAIRTLGRRKVVEASPALVRALASDVLGGHAVRALAGMGEVAAPALIAQLELGPGRDRAAYALGHLAGSNPTWPR